MLHIGCHSSYKDGILNAISKVHEIGGDVVQLFFSDSTSSSLKTKLKPSPDEIAEISYFLKSHHIQLFVHAVYVINFCNYPSQSGRIKYALNNVMYDLELCDKLGGAGVVLHFGNSVVSETPALAFKNMADNIAYILKHTASTVKNAKLLLETSAGQGRQIGVTLQEISQFIVEINVKYPKWHNRLGFCIDTAHIFASGYDIRTPAKWDGYMREFDQLVGFKHLYAFHLNDSASQLGDKRDRHRPLTAGHIFMKPDGHIILQHIKSFCIKHNIPIILETNGDSNYTTYKNEITYMKSSILHPTTSSLKSKHTMHTNINKTIKKPAVNAELNKLLIKPLQQMLEYYKAIHDNIRVAAYQRAIYQIKRFPRIITKGNDLKDIEGIGKKMISKLDEILTTGTLSALEDSQVKHVLVKLKETSPAIEELAAIYGIGEIIAKKLVKIGITNLDELKKAYDSGKVDLNPQQLLGIKYARDLAIPIPRSETLEIKERIAEYLSISEFKYIKVILAGSYPSGKLESKDVDIILTTKDISSLDQLKKSSILEDIVEILKNKGLIQDVFSVGYTKFLGIIKIHDICRHLDMRLIPEKYEIPAYFYYTSGADFNKLIREKAKRRNLKLSEWGLTDAISGKELSIKSEADIFKHLGLDFVPMNARR
jgi:deoxyribonuclease-4